MCGKQTMMAGLEWWGYHLLQFTTTQWSMDHGSMAGLRSKQVLRDWMIPTPPPPTTN